MGLQSINWRRVMGISGIGPGSLLLILAIILLIFGTKRIKNLGGDLGGAVKGFKKAMSDEDDKNDKLPEGNGKSLSEEKTSETDESK